MSEPKCSASASSASLDGFGGDAVEQAGAEEIDHDRDRDHAERPDRRLDRVMRAAEQAVAGLPDHDAGEQEQQRRLRQRGDALDLAVAVVVLLVGRLAGHAHREIGHDGRGEIEQRMRGFREHRQRAGGEPDHAFGDRQSAGREDRGEGDALLDVLLLLASAAVMANLLAGAVAPGASRASMRRADRFHLFATIFWAMRTPMNSASSASMPRAVSRSRR